MCQPEQSWQCDKCHPIRGMTSSTNENVTEHLSASVEYGQLQRVAGRQVGRQGGQGYNFYFLYCIVILSLTQCHLRWQMDLNEQWGNGVVHFLKGCFGISKPATELEGDTKLVKTNHFVMKLQTNFVAFSRKSFPNTVSLEQFYSVSETCLLLGEA